MGFFGWLGNLFGGGGSLAQYNQQKYGSNGGNVQQQEQQFAATQTGSPGALTDFGNALASATAVPMTATIRTAEYALDGLRWTYNHAVSQPLSTALLVDMRGQAGGSIGAYFSPSEWSRAWHAAEHISPGQAFSLTGYALTNGIDPRQLAGQVENAPLTYVKPQAAALPAGFDQLPQDQQQAMLKQMGMPVQGNAKIEQIRQDSTLFKYASGFADFGVNLIADPGIVAGKGLGALKSTFITKAAPAAVTVGKRTAEGVSALGRDITRPALAPGWTGQQIQDLVNSSNLVKARDWLWEHKDTPGIVNQLPLVQKSALGPRFGSILATLQSPDEVTDLLKVGMGDTNALVRLHQSNLLAAQRIEQDTDRLSTLGLMRSRVSQFPNLQRLIDQKMDALNAQRQADSALQQRYSNIIDHYGEIDSVNLTKWSFGRAERRAAAQSQYMAGPALRSNGPLKTRLSSDFFSNPMIVVRSFKNYRPNGYLRLDDIDNDAVNEVRGQISRIPGIGPQERQQLLDTYLKTGSDAERLDYARNLDRFATEQLAGKYGLTREQANDLYNEYMRRKGIEMEKLRAYSAARDPNNPDIYVDAFNVDGTGLKIEPNLATKLANDHTFMPLDELDRVLARHGRAIQAIIAGKTAQQGIAEAGRLGLARSGAGQMADWVNDSGEFLNSLWKFGTLFRLGYLPRVAGDDLAGQVARLGAASMAVRALKGAQNSFTNLTMRVAKPALEAQKMLHQQGIDMAQSELDDLLPRMQKLKTRNDARIATATNNRLIAERRLQQAQDRINNFGPTTRNTTRAAAQQLLAKRELELRQLERVEQKLLGTLHPGQVRYMDMVLQQGHLERSIDGYKQAIADIEKSQQKVIQGNQPFDLGDGRQLPPALDEYYGKLTSSEDDIRNLFARNKSMIHGNLVRAFGNGGIRITAVDDQARHADAWAHAINNQIMQDEFGRMAAGLVGQVDDQTAIEKLSKWLGSTAEGMAYRKRLALGVTSNEDIASSVWYEVNHYLRTPEIQAKAFDPEGVDSAFLKQAIPNPAARPEVHTGLLGEAMPGTNGFTRSMDRVMEFFYRTMASLPADRLSRHPLFNQLYEGHARRLLGQTEMQAGQKMDQAAVDQIAVHARRLALRDMKSLVFDIAHRSDAGQALRMISPFFAATTEGWQRWARIIGDHPQVVGYTSKFFTAPLATGHMVDQDGNPVDQYGYAIDPTTGKRALVTKSNRYIRVIAPKWVANGPIGHALGMDPSGNWQVSQDSANLVLQGDPWFNPGTGPVVQIPLDKFVADKPDLAELARTSGMLPFGVRGGSIPRELWQYLTPGTVQNLGTAFDASDERYQQVKLQIMQQNWYEHQELGKPLLSPKQVADRVRNYWLWSTFTRFSQPVSSQRRDPYQFFRDQYHLLLQKNPQTADQEYLNRFGEDHFVFAQGLSSGTGIPATKRAAMLAKQYGDIIAADPDLAALIVGPEGKGPFSPEAYTYELNTPLVPGGTEMMRSKMSADEAMKENQKRLGWNQFGGIMNILNSELSKRGLKTFNDSGAEDLKAKKQALVSLLGSPTMPDGSPNQFYNEQWAQAYHSIDETKYERLVPKLQELVNSPLAKEPSRSDLRTLGQYLVMRQAVNQMLQARKAAGGNITLTANSNSDLRKAFEGIVQGLVQGDTRFGDLYHRYLSRDMGLDLEQEAA